MEENYTYNSKNRELAASVAN